MCDSCVTGVTLGRDRPHHWGFAASTIEIPRARVPPGTVDPHGAPSDRCAARRPRARRLEDERGGVGARRAGPDRAGWTPGVEAQRARSGRRRAAPRRRAGLRVARGVEARAGAGRPRRGGRGTPLPGRGSLLRRVAVRVIALDVGYGQLDWSLRNDPRVEVLERMNARELRAADLPYVP